MVPVLLWILSRISLKTGTRMLRFRIFVHKTSRMIKTKGSLAPTTPAEVLPEGVGAGGSDYMEVSSQTKSPGARLQSYWKVWENFKVHPRVVLVLKQGYCLPFKQSPPLTRFPTIKSSYSAPVKQKALLEAVQQMVKKRAVVPVQNKNSLGFYSRLFLVPKPENKWRPVIDLSVVNTFLHVPTFKMETAEAIRASLQAGEWVASIDLTDAYFHVLIHQKFQKYLRFHVQGQAYQFRALPFGIATAPLEFTRVVKEVKFIALSQGVRIHQYLDDWLVRAKDPDSCARDVQKLINLVQKLGWIVNLKKSELRPTQDLEFLGYRFNLREGLVYPNQKKLDKLKILAVSILQGHSTTPRKLMSLIGVMASMEKTVPSGRIHMRPFQWFLKTNWQFPQSLDKIVPISQLIRDHLAWWMDPQNLLKGSSLHQKEHNVLIFTDASGKGWGAHLSNCTISGVWQQSERNLHINILELKAVFLALKHFQGQLRQKNSIGFFRQLNCGLLYQQGRRHSLLRNVCFDVENSGVVQCQGDPDQSQTYCRESQCNSRLPVQEGQGHSDRVVFASSGLSKNLPSLAQANGGSVCHQLECQTSNLRISCPRRQGLADRCIEHLLGGSGRLCVLSSSHPSPVSSENGHLQVQGHCNSTRVAGNALVLGSGGLSVKIPLRLPQVYNLLKQPFSLRFHKNLEYLNLHAWYLDSYKKVKEDSLLRWQIELRHLRENPQGECMIQGGPFFKSRPRRIRWMSQNQLFLK